MGIGTQFLLKPGLQRCGLFRFQGVETCAVVLLGPEFHQPFRFPVQPVGGPVRGGVGPVAPDLAQLVAPDGTPYVLAPEHVVAAENHFAIGSYHPFGQGRGHLVHLAAKLEQGGKGAHHENYEPHPVVQQAPGHVVLRIWSIDRR